MVNYIGYSIDGNLQSADLQLINEQVNSNFTFKITSKKRGFITKINLHFSLDKWPNSIVSNGFQSWSECNYSEKGFKKKNIWGLAYPLMGKMGDYAFANYPNGKNITTSWHYTYAQYDEKVLLLGSLSPQLGYCHFIWDKSANQITVSLFVETNIKNRTLDFSLYVKLAKEQANFQSYFLQQNLKTPQTPKQKFTGWTSWYNYYTDINDEIINTNASNFINNKLPINYFQIDDGWQTAIGDWDINSKFPNGLNPLTKKLKQNNINSGLWLAPFVAEKKSALFKNKPQWFIKDDKGKLLKVGYNPLWSGWFYALDTELPEVRTYIKTFLRRCIDQWGFKLLKLDFLYAAGILPRNNKSRGQLMWEAMVWLREVLKDTEILGCGVPLNTAFFNTDFCRIGPDISHTWDVKWLKWVNHSERLSTKNAIGNVIHRRQLDHLPFKNDPDVFMLRTENQKLDRDQQFTLYLVNQLFGSLIFTSDNLKNYDNWAWQLYKSQFPAKPLNIQKVTIDEAIVKVFFKGQQNEFLALCNLGKKAQQVNLKDKYFIQRNTETSPLTNAIQSTNLNAYQSQILIKADEGAAFQIIKSNRHLFAGNEFDLFEVEGNYINCQINEHAQEGETWVQCPSQYKSVFVNGNIKKPEQFGNYYTNLLCI